jgi:peroxiredoxin
MGGDDVGLRQAVEHVPLLLLVFAPGSWSPATRRQIAELNAAIETLHEIGLGVVVVVTEEREALWRRFGSHEIPFPILADQARAVARDFGVFRSLSWDGIGVTRPAAFLLDRALTVRFAYVGSGEKDVPETEALINLSRSIVFGSAAAVWQGSLAVAVDGAPPDESQTQEGVPTEAPLAEPEDSVLVERVLAPEAVGGDARIAGTPMEGDEGAAAEMPVASGDALVVEERDGAGVDQNGRLPTAETSDQGGESAAEAAPSDGRQPGSAQTASARSEP